MYMVKGSLTVCGSCSSLFITGQSNVHAVLFFLHVGIYGKGFSIQCTCSCLHVKYEEQQFTIYN